MSDWLPTNYLKFSDERTRPARDLLAQVQVEKPQLVYDLGCGPGTSTELLVGAYPEASVIGVDSSPAMIALARKAVAKATFIEADLNDWTLGDAADLVFSNAMFQWLPDHLTLMRDILASLKSGAVLALQMPDNLLEPSHRLMAETAASGPWAVKLAQAQKARDVLPSPQTYYDVLKPYCRKLEIWHTVYNHPLPGVEGIVDWFSTTGLRPFLNPLSPDEREQFLTVYRKKLTAAYMEMADGQVLLRLPRLFIVAQA